MSLAAWTPQAVADALGKLSGVESWWSPHLFGAGLSPATGAEKKRGLPDLIERPDHYRAECLWQCATVLALDLDYHDGNGKHAPMPADLRERLHAADLPGNLYHDTPRGARLVAVLAQAVADVDDYTRAVLGFAAQAREALRAADLLSDRGGLDVDTTALDRARLLFAPAATVAGVKRAAPVVVLREALSNAANWCHATPAEPAPAEPEAQDASAPLPPVPFEAFPPAVARYIQAVAENRCVDPAMPATFALGMAAGAVGRAAVIDLRPDWREIPVLWLGHVAPPGKLKSPTLKTLAAPLHVYDNELDARHAAALCAWEEECRLCVEKKEKPPDRPRRSQAIVGDATIEALADVVEVSPRVTGIYDELGSLFDSMGAYKKGGGHDRQAWLSLHCGAPMFINRKGKDPLIVPDPRLTIVGATTPSTCARVLGTLNGDGMVDRFLLTRSTPRPNRFCTAPVPQDLRDKYTASVAALCALPTREPRVLTLAADAAAVFAPWYESLDCAAVPPHFQGVLGKLAGHAGRIALTLALWHDPQAVTVAADVMRGAIVMVEWLAEHTADVRSAQNVSAGATRLADWLRKQGGRAALRDVYRANVGGAKNVAEAEVLGNELVKSRVAVWSTRDTVAGNETRELILIGGGA